MSGSKLAVDGGTPVVASGAVGDWPVITESDKQAVLAVLESDPLMIHGVSAPKTLELQAMVCQMSGAKYALATNGGTSALHMALAVVGVQPGDEVITSAMSYWATPAAVVHQNAVPVFADIDPVTHTIDPTRIEEKITSHTKAILPVHIHGMPADMNPIMSIARQHGLAVVEDACQAHGATYRGRGVGSIGHAAAFSFNRSKNATGGEGGAMTTNSRECWQRAEEMRSFGSGERYTYSGLGFNYRPNEMESALTCGQMSRLAENNATRIMLAEYLTAGLAGIPGFAGPAPSPYPAVQVYWRYVLECQPQELGLGIKPNDWRRAAEWALQTEGLPIGQWQPIILPDQAVFKNRRGYGRGCPWTCPHGSGQVHYHRGDYPVATRFIESFTYLDGVRPPNGTELIDLYLEAFARVAENAPLVWDLYNKQAV